MLRLRNQRDCKSFTCLIVVATTAQLIVTSNVCPRWWAGGGATYVTTSATKFVTLSYYSAFCIELLCDFGISLLWGVGVLEEFL